MIFEKMDEIRRICVDLPAPDDAALRAAEARNGQLTKPPGALGRLEELALWYAAWRGDPTPSLTRLRSSFSLEIMGLQRKVYLRFRQT